MVDESLRQALEFILKLKYLMNINVKESQTTDRTRAQTSYKCDHTSVILNR